jgi:hypothetical protein
VVGFELKTENGKLILTATPSLAVEFEEAKIK